MRLRLRHQIRLRFPEPTRNVINVLRMIPRSHEGQRVTNWRIDVDPDCLLKAGEDHFGNLTHTLAVPGLVSELVVTAQGELTSFDALGVVRGTAERLPIEIYRRDTALTTPDEALRNFAEGATTGSDNQLGSLHRLLSAIHEAVVLSTEGCGPVGVAQAFASKRGCSEDHAQIFAGCARHLGFPARCASGFFLDEEGLSRRHAWAEAYVDGLGWVGFDTVHDICPQDYHVRVAIGLDAVEASALRGVPGGSFVESVDVSWLFGREPQTKSQSSASA